MNNYHREFLIESNRIEGIDISEATLEHYWANPDDRVTSEEERHARNSVRAFNYALEKANEILDLPILFRLHELQMDMLLEPVERGALRTVPVWVGPHPTPAPIELPHLIANFVMHFRAGKRSIPWLHFEFESIHPFVDGNGRTGRLLWAMDRLRRGNEVIPILDGFRARGDDFYERRDRYYAAIQQHRKPHVSIAE